MLYNPKQAPTMVMCNKVVSCLISTGVLTIWHNSKTISLGKLDLSDLCRTKTSGADA